jgi:FAD/FMN-containing dehydrogenase
MSDTLLDSLRQLFTGRLLTTDEEMRPFLTDWRGKWRGTAMAVALPASTREVAQLMAWCHDHSVPVVPQGGNTGLSGGSVPQAQHDSQTLPIVLSLTRLNRVRSVDPLNGTLIAEAGVTLLQVQQAALAHGRLFPLSLAAEGTCTIGGNLASNAGGVQVLRYGNARELCLGLEVVTPEGEIWDGLRTLRKDNTGYALRDLYIGSEGTLGVITAAVLKLFPVPAAQTVSLLAVATPDDALQFFALAQQKLGASLTAFELLSETCLSLVLGHIPNARRPLAEVSPWYVLMEVSVGDETSDAQTHVAQATESLLEVAMQAGLLADAVVSSSLAQFEALWAIRENISEAQGAAGPTIKHDIALPISKIPAFIASTDAAIARAFPKVRLVTFGHLGDGNLHYNVSPAENQRGAETITAFLSLEAAMNLLVHDAVHAFGGSISAEHGLGVLRRDESARYKSPVEMKLMKCIKSVLDPQGLMNPSKLLV